MKIEICLSLLVAAISVNHGQTTPDQSEGRPKYQRSLTDLVPANFITVLDKYHRPITNNYIPEPTKQKLSKEEILARFTPRQTTTTTTTTTTAAPSTTRKPTSFVTSYPSIAPILEDSSTETPFRILFIQTTTVPPSLSSSAALPTQETDSPSSFFTRVVTQTAKTVTVIEDGKEKTETLPTVSNTQTTLPPTTTVPTDFNPVFIYKNQRFTDQSKSTDDPSTEKKVITAESTTSSSNVDAKKKSGKATLRPRRKVIKVKSRKIVKDTSPPEKLTTLQLPAVTTEIPITNETSIKALSSQKASPRAKFLFTRRLITEIPLSETLVTTPESITESFTSASSKARRPARRLSTAPTASTEATIFERQSTRPSQATTELSQTSDSGPFSTESPRPTSPKVTEAPRTTEHSRKDSLKGLQRRPGRRVVTRIVTRRPSSTIPTTVSPFSVDPTSSPESSAIPTYSRSFTIPTSSQSFTILPSVTSSFSTTELPSSSTTKPHSGLRKKKRRPIIHADSSSHTTPSSIIFFQTTARPTTETPVESNISNTEPRRVPKRRRKKLTTAAAASAVGVVSTQPVGFSPTEPSTFSAPLAITGFRPISTPNYFLAPSHLNNLPKTDEISQVIDLPNGRLSSYQARYSPAIRNVPQSERLTSDPFSSSLPVDNPKPYEPQFTHDPGQYFTNDPTYQELQRLLASETSRFHNQPRSRLTGSHFPPSIDFRS